MLPFKPWLCSCEERRCISNFLATRNCQHNLLAGARAAEKRTKGRACGGGGEQNISAVRHGSAVTRGVGDNRRWAGRGGEPWWEQGQHQQMERDACCSLHWAGPVPLCPHPTHPIPISLSLGVHIQPLPSPLSSQSYRWCWKIKHLKSTAC